VTATRWPATAAFFLNGLTLSSHIVKLPALKAGLGTPELPSCAPRLQPPSRSSPPRRCSAGSGEHDPRAALQDSPRPKAEQALGHP